MTEVAEFPPTAFAPSKRAGDAEVARSHALLASTLAIEQLLNSFPEAAVVLNSERQIVFANDKLAALLSSEPNQLLGKRPGEALQCIHAYETAGRCGTTEFCSQCGAVRAILNCEASRTAQTEDCRITCSSEHGQQSLDLRVWATPLNVDGVPFTVFAVRDTTDEKRRAVMERLFFHDVLNAAGGLQGLLDLLPRLEPGRAIEMSGLARRVTAQLIDEIQSQRDLASAERGDLKTTAGWFDAVDMMRRLCVLYRHHTCAIGKHIVDRVVTDTRTIQSNEILLSRILGNLIKNAVEACSAGETTTVTFENSAGPTFTVHNPGAMSKEVQLQIFQRSFSTKAATGRGIGTYSVKMFTERYLGGTVTFASSMEAGTTFTIRLKP